MHINIIYDGNIKIIIFFTFFIFLVIIIEVSNHQKWHGFKVPANCVGFSPSATSFFHISALPQIETKLTTASQDRAAANQKRFVAN